MNITVLHNVKFKPSVVNEKGAPTSELGFCCVSCCYKGFLSLLTHCIKQGWVGVVAVMSPIHFCGGSV